MTPMMKLINALNAVIVALQELVVTETKSEIDSFENIYTPPELEEKSTEQPEKEQPKKEQSAEPQKTEVTLDDVRKVLAEKSRMGYKAEVKALVKKYGADKVSELPEGTYAAVLKEAEQIGK